MASTPLYKSLKSKGTTTYVFPSAAEDISAAYNNSNYKMYFSKFALLNFPKQNLVSSKGKVVMDFDNTFHHSSNAIPASTFKEQIVESLRNYVANQEVVIKESRLNTKEYFYDTNVLSTISEKVFFKWAKNVNLIDFEPATPSDEYFNNLTAFQRNSLTDDEYFPEYLWRERKINSYTITGYCEYNNEAILGLIISKTTNLRVGDFINLSNVEDDTLKNIPQLKGCDTSDGVNIKIYGIITNSDGSQIIALSNTSYNSDTVNVNAGDVHLIYNRFVQYIGEITGISNVQEANRNYTEVYAHIPDSGGSTPDILYRTTYDDNYAPNLSFPIIASQIQPEIMGAESFTSPIVSSPQSYPGSYYAQFDTADYEYDVATGDELRRSGKYFGIKGDINNYQYTYDDSNRSTIDGISMDFDYSHYVRMNLAKKIINTFDEFNELEINNEPPKDFEFNAILWYYTVEKTESDGTTSTSYNLYGISFFDNPDNNEISGEEGVRFPVYKKLVATDEHDGTSYAFSLNLNFNIINDNPQPTYNPEAINSLFSMNLFNTAMSRLASTNDSFIKMLTNYNNLVDDISDLKQMIYTTTDINTINAKITNLESLLKMYSTMQISDTNSIKVTTSNGTPAYMSLYSITPHYDIINTVKTSDMYSSTNIISYNVDVPENRSFMINVINNDTTNINITNNDNLKILLNTELNLYQVADFHIDADTSATQNKKLDICINITDTYNATTEAILLGDIDLPIYCYSTYDNSGNTIVSMNSAYSQTRFPFTIDLSKDILYDTSTGYLKLYLSGNYNIMKNSVNIGDVLVLNDLFINYSNVVYDFSSQYMIANITTNDTNSEFVVYLDINSNEALVNFCSDANDLNKNYLHHVTDDGNVYPELNTIPYFGFNKGIDIRVICINTNTSLNIADRYVIEKKI